PPAPDIGLQARDLASLTRPLVRTTRGTLEWSHQPVRAPGLGLAPLTRVLGEILAWRSTVRLGCRASQAGAVEDARAEEPTPGVDVFFPRGLPVPVRDLDLLARARTDDQRLAYLLEGMLMLDWTWSKANSAPWDSASPEPVAAHPALALLAPFFQGLQLGVGRSRLVPAASWARQLSAGKHRDVLAEALGRLRWAALVPLLARPDLLAQGTDGQRLAACMLARVKRHELAQLLSRVAMADEASVSQGTSQ
ncbi:MAG: hypothetical protein ACP5VR_12715, partial [Acidimicrobiales bacterium]